jgi:hypothetical protein
MNHPSVEELILQSSQSSTTNPFNTIDTNRPLISTQPSNSVNSFEPSHPSSFIDIHTFDYSYRDAVHTAVMLTDNEKRQWITSIMNRMTNQTAIQGARIIMANINHDGNRDHTNQKNAEDLLVLLARHCIEKDQSVISLLEEQLQDMVELGQCAQGRTTRLWQLYVALQ